MIVYSTNNTSFHITIEDDYEDFIDFVNKIESEQCAIELDGVTTIFTCKEDRWYWTMGFATCLQKLGESK